MSVYYVANNGLDTNNGTFENPFKTIQKALNTIAKGDTVYVRGGFYSESLIMRRNGDKDNYITIKNYNEEIPIIDGGSLSTTYIVSMNGKSYINFDGFKVQNMTKAWSKGIYMTNSESYINIRNCEITDIHCLDATSQGDASNPLLCFGNKIKPIHHITIENCYVHNCTTGWAEAIAISGNCEYVDVINCVVDDTGNIGIDFAGNFGYCSIESLDQPRHCKATDNIVSNCNSPNFRSYGLYTDGGRDILFERNIVFNSQGGIEIGSEEAPGKKYPCKNIIVRNNLVYNCSQVGMNIGAYRDSAGYVKDIEVYNNTFYGNPTTLNLDIGDNFSIKNNIFVSTEANTYMVTNYKTIEQTKNVNLSNNIYHSPAGIDDVRFMIYNTLARGFNNWVDATNEIDSYYQDPTFVDISNGDFSVDSLSVAIDNGDNSVFSGKLDLNNNVRLFGNIDIGAYEFNSIPPIEHGVSLIDYGLYIGNELIGDIYLGSESIDYNSENTQQNVLPTFSEWTLSSACVEISKSDYDYDFTTSSSWEGVYITAPSEWKGRSMTLGCESLSPSMLRFQVCDDDWNEIIDLTPNNKEGTFTIPLSVVNPIIIIQNNAIPTDVCSIRGAYAYFND